MLEEHKPDMLVPRFCTLSDTTFLVVQPVSRGHVFINCQGLTVMNGCCIVKQIAVKVFKGGGVGSSGV
jgi:hypothetical protein